VLLGPIPDSCRRLPFPDCRLNNLDRSQAESQGLFAGLEYDEKIIVKFAAFYGKRAISLEYQPAFVAVRDK